MTLFGDILRLHRMNHGLSQHELADRLGISRTYLSQIERGRADNLSWKLALRILSLQERHEQVEVMLHRRVMIDAAIAPEILWLNTQEVVTEGSCQGPPPTAVIQPGSVDRARELGYKPVYREDTGMFLITLKSGEVARP